MANPKTMEILAMASSPEFDPNNYSAIMDSLLQGEASSNVQGIYEQLKAENALEWTGRMNSIRACARKIVEREIIYA